MQPSVYVPAETSPVRSPEWCAWQAMRRRCFNSKSKNFHWYGGRGITVCQRWSIYANFLADMGRRPSAAHSLDRIDNNGNYEPGNCRWATWKEQERNRRDNRILQHGEQSKPLSQWADEYGLRQDTFRRRIDKYHMSIEEALTRPVRAHNRKPRD